MSARPRTLTCLSLKCCNGYTPSAALVVWLLCIMLPLYGTINSFMGAIGVPTTAFLLPAAAFTWHFRKREARDAAVFPAAPVRPGRRPGSAEAGCCSVHPRPACARMLPRTLAA